MSFISIHKTDCSCENVYIHSANTEPRTAMRIREHPHSAKCIQDSRQEVQVHKSEVPVHMFKLLNVLGCF